MDATLVRALKIQRQDNLWFAPSVVLFKKDPKNDELRIVSIAIENFNYIDSEILNEEFPKTLKNLTIITPSDGLAWEMTKIHTLQNLIYISSFYNHLAIIHLSLSYTTAIASMTLESKSLSNHQSLIEKFISIHTYMQVPLDSMALHHEMAIFHLKNEFYPFNLTGSNTIFDFLERSMNGWGNHPIYKPYDKHFKIN